MDDNLQKNICQQLLTYMTQALLLPCREKVIAIPLCRVVVQWFSCAFEVFVYCLQRLFYQERMPPHTL